MFIRNFLALAVFIFILNNVVAQNNNIMPDIGAYYFNGWTKHEFNKALVGGNQRYSKELLSTYSNREPVYGWVTCSQLAIDAQIIAAANNGLKFWCFDLYYGRGGYHAQDWNKSLFLYESSINKNKLRYCSMITNDTYDIGPKEWDSTEVELIRQFKTGTYYTYQGKPIVIIYNLKKMSAAFGGPDNLKKALIHFKKKALNNGFKGVLIGSASMIGPDKVQQIYLPNMPASYFNSKECGIDFLTGYNFHYIGFVRSVHKNLKNNVISNSMPIQSLIDRSVEYWSEYLNPLNNVAHLPYLTNITLNWDNRPLNLFSKDVKYFMGFSQTSIAQSIFNGLNFYRNNSKNTLLMPIVLLYAWNEYSEGAYLTPSKNGDNFVGGVKDAINLFNDNK